LADQLCLFALISTPREKHERLLTDLLAPLARDLRGAPELESLFFARYNVPTWQVRLTILGQSEWVAGPVRERVERDVEHLSAVGVIEGIEYTRYERELPRYGGEEGMLLAEKIFFQDSLACLDLIEAERQGHLGKTRREISLLLTERLLDFFRFDRAQRLAFYAYGYQWTREMGTWDGDDLGIIDRRYEDLQTGLQDLFSGEQSREPDLLWGGEVPAGIALRWMEATRPLIDALREGLAAGRIHQDPNYLAWSYAHMNCNRLGIDSTPEALLRYFMHRLMADGGGPRDLEAEPLGNPLVATLADEP
jgi:thiopeptide-type bacteriocin biosynthesis protein